MNDETMMMMIVNCILDNEQEDKHSKETNGLYELTNEWTLRQKKKKNPIILHLSIFAWRKV